VVRGGEARAGNISDVFARVFATLQLPGAFPGGEFLQAGVGVAIDRWGFRITDTLCGAFHFHPPDIPLRKFPFELLQLFRQRGGAFFRF
jgi:hypothetical protein